MAQLSKNWITENVIDFEYKKYILLAYLTKVNEHFSGNMLYPDLAELVEHYLNIKELKQNKDKMNDRSKTLEGFDWEKFAFVYKKIMNDDRIMKEIEDIIDFSIPQFEYYLKEGKKIYEFIESNIHIESIGVMPLNTDEGYLFLRGGPASHTEVYEYSITIFEQAEDRYRAIHTRFIDKFRLGISTSYQSIKQDLIHSHSKLPNPAVFAIESELSFPVKESFLPVAKRSIVRYVSTITPM